MERYFGKMYFRFFSKGIVTGILSLFLLAAIGLQPAHALDKSRFFTWLLFFSGLSSSAAGVVIQGQANETYDEYMHTAVQARMDELIDNYDRKHQQSIIASRVGLGLVVSAIFLSLVDAAHIPPPEVQTAPTFGSELGILDHQSLSMFTQNGEILLAIGRRF
jgi:hypothetical protein